MNSDGRTSPGSPAGSQDSRYQQHYRQYGEQSRSGHQNPNSRSPAQKPPKSRKSGRRVAKRIVKAAVIFVIFFLLFRNLDLIDELIRGDVSPREYPEALDYTITRRVTFSSTTSNFGFDMSVPLPNNITSIGGSRIQTIHDSRSMESSGVERSSRTEAEIFDIPPQGNDRIWWVWYLPQESGGSHFVEKTHDINSRTVRWSIDESMSATVNDIESSADPGVVELRNRYLGEEWVIEPDHPSIKAQAEILREGTEGNVYSIVRNSFQWMRSEFSYETDVQPAPKYANETFADRRGDCDDQSALLASLLRANGIPAWLELGGLYDRMRGAWGGHAWLKVYIPMVDSGGDFDPSTSGTVDIDVVNDEFFFRSCYRYAEWESDGNGEHLKEYYVFVRYWGQADVRISWETADVEPSGRVVYVTRGGEVMTPHLGLPAVLSIVGLAYLYKKKRLS